MVTCYKTKLWFGYEHSGEGCPCFCVLPVTTSGLYLSILWVVRTHSKDDVEYTLFIRGKVQDTNQYLNVRAEASV